MRPERRRSEIPNGGKWEFSEVNNWLQPAEGETFEIKTPHPVHEKIQTTLEENFLDTNHWKARSIIQSSPWEEGDLPRLYFVFENPLKNLTTESPPRFKSALKSGVTPNANSISEYEAFLPTESVQRVLEGTNMFCDYLSIRFNGVVIERRRIFGRQQVNIWQNGVIFFQLGFSPVDERIGELQEEAKGLFRRSESLENEAEGLLLSKVSKPESLFVNPPLPTPTQA